MPSYGNSGYRIGKAIIVQIKRNEHISQVKKDLHWLPISQRIVYKVLLLTYKALHGLAPKYLHELLEPCQSSRNVANLTLKKPQSKSKYGDRAFKMAAPKLWNDLPHEIRQSPKVGKFTRKLKAHLFTKAYGVDT